jgi:hypothetical protein
VDVLAYVPSRIPKPHILCFQIHLSFIVTFELTDRPDDLVIYRKICYLTRPMVECGRNYCRLHDVVACAINGNLFFPFTSHYKAELFHLQQHMARELGSRNMKISESENPMKSLSIRVCQDFMNTINIVTLEN